MLIAAAVLFALAAVGGLSLAIFFISKKNPPLALVVGHGIPAATGLVIFLIWYLRNGTGGLAAISLGLFILAALGGFGLFVLKNKPLPIILVHGLVAATAFVLLIIHLTH